MEATAGFRNPGERRGEREGIKERGAAEPSPRSRGTVGASGSRADRGGVASLERGGLATIEMRRRFL